MIEAVLLLIFLILWWGFYCLITVLEEILTAMKKEDKPL